MDQDWKPGARVLSAQRPPQAASATPSARRSSYFFLFRVTEGARARVTRPTPRGRLTLARGPGSDVGSLLFCIAVVLTKKKPTGGMNGVPKSADAVRLTPHSTLP